MLYQAECKACCSVDRATLLPAETHNKMFLLLTNINPECTQPPPKSSSTFKSILSNSQFSCVEFNIIGRLEASIKKTYNGPYFLRGISNCDGVPKSLPGIVLDIFPISGGDNL